MIPLPIIIACIVLAVFFAITLVQMILENGRATAAMAALGEALYSQDLSPRGDRRFGLRNEQLGAVRNRCGALRGAARIWWSRVEENIERYSPPNGPDGSWLAQPPRDILPEEIVIGRMYNGSFYQAVPGILTGLGLLSTFVAILLALKGLHVGVTNNTETVTGIKELIEGLSGKFVSSIVGLLLSIAFVLVERRWCEKRLDNGYQDLIEAVSNLFPTLTPIRVQLDAQAQASRGTELLLGIARSLEGVGDKLAIANSTVPDAAADLAGEVKVFSAKLREIGSLLDRGVDQLR